MAKPYHIIQPTSKRVPIIISVPHCGSQFPDELAGHFREDLAQNPDDTDFEVDRLYGFAAEMGITMIHSHYCRWVIDLNRTPNGKSLYSDGRIITALTPTTNFFNDPIYKNQELEPNEEEIERRKSQYYIPYHDKLNDTIHELRAEFGKVILWEAHSIRSKVPAIHKDRFPDLILGDNDGNTADHEVVRLASTGLKQGDFELTYNFPFKGGYITRLFGDPENGVHAIQLEMVKSLYMDDLEVEFNEERAEKVRSILKPTFESLIHWISN